MKLKVFPCQNKTPLLGSNGLYDARPIEEVDPETSEQWGLVTGKEAGFFVLDVDQKSGGLETLKVMPELKTFNVNTQNGGKHFYFKYPKEGGYRNKVGFVPGWDIRADGGYVVMYDDVDIDAIQEAPQWLLSIINREERAKVDLKSFGEVGEGGRNHFLAAAAGRMQKIGVLTLSALQELNEARCNPPLDDREVESVFKSVSRYAPDSTPSEDEVELPPSLVWMQDLIKPFLAYLRDKDQIKGMPSGLPELDKLIGGFRKGEITALTAMAKTGKNTFLHWLHVPILSAGIPIGYASQELSPEVECLPDLLTVATKKNLRTTDDFTEEELLNAMKDWKLAFTPEQGIYPKEKLFPWMDLCREAGIEFFIIDHMHFLLSNSEDFKEVSTFIRELKRYARKHNVHVLMIIQPKNQERGVRLSLDSMRGGSAIGQAIDTMLTLERERDENGDLMDVVRLSVEAARSKMAKTGSFFLAYDKNTICFSVVEKVAEERPSTPVVIEPQHKIVVAPQRSADPLFDASKAASNMINRMKGKTL